MKTYFPAKLLLFGEYTVIQGSQALAIPYHQYFGNWSFDPASAKDQQNNLLEWSSYLLALQAKKEHLFEIDIEALQTDLEKGLFFDSNIPTGYGVGSSGALCAGLFSRYGRNKRKE